ncbi:MAG: hypothetical protein C4527_14500 [Candidatus Omnitrophota bacterium]|jgi:hypothetical protein|nr:MAG: hypothetical protein C4527_14500 [Candidatus Omnitrophota bacterium]
MVKHVDSALYNKRSRFFAPGFFIVVSLGIGAAAVLQTDGGDRFQASAIEKVDSAPIRGEVEPLRLRRSGFEFKCSECHRTFETSRNQKALVAEHTNLIFAHGSNDYCLNCHHRTNRDAYANHDGSEIPADQPARLCAKCHGLIYRDWLVGIHGRLRGTWDPADSGSERILCIQCHDPHQPKFPDLKPMPGPMRGRVHVYGGEM